MFRSFGRDMRSFPLFQGFRRCLFYDVSTSRFREAGLRILPRSFGAGELRFPPLIRREKHSSLPPVTAEKTPCPSHGFLDYVQ